MGDAGPSESNSSPISLFPVPNPTISIWQSSHRTDVAHYHSTSELPTKSQVVIIGSGISAVFAARELLSTSPGTDVLVLEARGTCSGATGRNGGHLLPAVNDDRDVLDFEVRNFHHVADMIEREGIHCDLRRLSSVHGYWNQTYFDEVKEQLANLRRHAPDLARQATVVEDRNELIKLRLRSAVGAVIETTAASLSPYKLVTWMWKDMLKRYPNLNLQTDTATTEIRRSTSPISSQTAWAVDTPRGCVSAECLLLAINGYTTRLLPQFQDLITPLQLTMSALRPPPSSPFRHSLIEHSYAFFGVGPMDRVQDDHLVQQPIVAGGQLMFGGARAVAKGNGVGISDDSFIDETARQYLRTQLGKVLDLDPISHEKVGLEEPLNSDGEWSGIAGYSRDHRPWVGGVPGMDGVFLCGGYTGHGMPNAALCGKHVASLVSHAVSGRNWLQAQEIALEEGAIPSTYAVTAERMVHARSLPMFPVPNTEL